MAYPAPPTLVTLPEFPNFRNRVGYNVQAYEWGSAIPEYSVQLRALTAYNQGAAAFCEAKANNAETSKAAAEVAADRAESSADNVSEAWGPAKAYETGARVFVATPVEYSKYTYRRRVAGTSATPPYSDPTNWAQINGDYVELTKLLAAGSNLNAVVTSGFYELSTAHVNAPDGVNGGQLIVSRGGASCMQQVSSTAGDLYFRTGRALDTVPVWTRWQRNFTDGALIESSKVWSTAASTYSIDPSVASANSISVYNAITVNVVAPRGVGDQLSILFSMNGAHPITFSANVRPPDGGMPAFTVGRVWLVALIARPDNYWALVVGGANPW